MANEITIEFAFGLSQEQVLLELSLAEGATVADAIAAAALHDRFPELNTEDLPAGIWGKPVSRTHTVSDGDRVELYRSLKMDPREARRALAEAGRTMRE